MYLHEPLERKKKKGKQIENKENTWQEFDRKSQRRIVLSSDADRKLSSMGDIERAVTLKRTYVIPQYNIALLCCVANKIPKILVIVEGEVSNSI